MRQKRVSVTYIAELLGVSIATVSRALNDHPAVGKEIKAKVRKVAEELCYVPNAGAVNLKSGKKNAIGVIVPNINRSFFSSVIESIEEDAYVLGVDVLISHSKNSSERERRIIESLQGKVDGVIASLASDGTDHTYYNRLNKVGIPLVLFDRVCDSVIGSTVVIDDFNGCYKATQHLISQGAKKIFHFAGPQNMKLWRMRKQGYMAAIRDSGIELCDDWITEIDPSLINGVEYAKRLIRDNNIPDAISFAGDFAAAGAIREFALNGIKTPQDILVTGFANEPFCEFMMPTLTSINQFPQQIGKSAFATLMEMMSGGEINHITISPELIIRGSSVR